MLEGFPVAVTVGTLLGLLAGLGVGGGSLLVLWLTLILSFPQPEARAINLVFFIPSALICSLFRWKQGALPLKKVLPAIIAGCISAAVFSYAGRFFDTWLLKKLFGLLLLVTGIKELSYRDK